MELSNKAQRVWCAIAYYIHHTGVSPGRTDLELLTGIHCRAMERYIWELRTYGYLTASPSHSARTIIWLMIWPPVNVFLQPSCWPAPRIISLEYDETQGSKAAESAVPM